MKKNEKIPSYKIEEIQRELSEEHHLQFHRLEYFVREIDHLKRPHRHDHFALFYITKGRGQHVIDFNEYELQPNRIYLISPGQVHAWKAHNHLHGYVLLFTKEFFSLTAQYPELRAYFFTHTMYKYPYTDLDKVTCLFIQDIFNAIEQETKLNKPHRQSIIRCYLNIILYHILRVYERDLPPLKKHKSIEAHVHTFGELVNIHFKTKRTVTDYAALLCITPNYLNAICTQLTGKAAGEIIRDRLMLEAKRLLAHSDNTIAQISTELNFEDNSYFGRFFKKYSGQTPAEFRFEVKNDV